MPVVLTYSVRDEKGKTGNFSVNLPDGTTLANLIGFAASLAPIVDAVITGAITAIGISIPINLAPGAVDDTASVNSDREEGAYFSFQATNAPTGFRIPTFNETFIAAGTDVVDVTLPSVAALVTAIEDGLDTTAGGGSGVVQPVDSRGDAITALLYAEESFQTYRK